MKDAKRNSLLVYGGDPLGSDGLGKGYLSDIWRLNLSEHYTELEWQRLAIAEGEILDGILDSGLAGYSVTPYSCYDANTYSGCFVNKRQSLLCEILRGFMHSLYVSKV